MSPDRPQTAIVTCMDARLDAFQFFDPFSEVVHVLRTAGGRVTEDVMRGLAASCAMGTERVIVMHHTDCAMAKHSEEQIRELLPSGPQPEIDFLTIGEPLAALTRDFHAVRSSTLLPDGVEVQAMIFDLETGEASEVEIADSVENLGEMRRDYRRAELDEGWLAATWLEQFTLWFDEARANAEIVEPNAMVFATAGSDGRPTARTVLLKAIDERGLVLYTNLRSRKGQAATENPRGCVVFPWHPIERQVIVSGELEPVAGEEADAYFASRPYGARIGALASPQSQPIPDRSTLESAREELESRYPPDGDIPRPEHWGGLRLVPETVEFWQGRPNRLHDRLRFRCEEGGDWRVERLAP
ncbi:MAG TPA: pyridoxamine 5'-phosphate oxidase [Solirubrobacterales bacterium]|nr:pyridoxamine 5'-phosphate oxidase [Solirubrobacterales bacterium]